MGRTAVVPEEFPVLGVYTPAFRLSHGELIVCSGLTPVDKNAATVGIEDAGAQTRQILRNLERLLETAGASLADVVHLRVFSTDMDNRQAINSARLEFFQEPLPASTHVQVVRLVDPDWLLEIEATAFVPA